MGNRGLKASPAQDHTTDKLATGPLAAAAGSLLAHAEPGLLIVAAPLLLFPHGYLPWIGLGLLIIGWVLRGTGTGVWLAQTPLNRPIAVLLIMTIVSLYPSVDLDLSMPKFFGIILCLFIFFAVVSKVDGEHHFWLGIWLLVASTVAVSLLGLIGTDWTTYKFSALEQIYSMVPRLIGSVQTSFGASTGFHSNEVGGTLAFLLPLPLALIFGAPLTRLRKAILGVVVLLGLGTLVLTASRSALMSMALATLVLVVWRWRRSGLVALFAVLATFAIGLSLNASGILNFLLKADVGGMASGGGTLAARNEIWDRAGYMIQDFPFTGIGLNTFPVMLKTLYPSFVVGTEAGIPHAHNIFLQSAVDLGLGGLLGFLGLWACTAYTGRAAYRQAAEGNSAHSPVQAAIAGMLTGLLSYLVYGLTDAITLGAKPTGLLWLMMGLLVSIQRITFNRRPLAGTLQPAAPNSCSSLRRSLRFCMVTAWDSYWIITFILVGLGLLVVAKTMAGWIL